MMIGQNPILGIRKGREIIGQRDEFVKCSDVAKGLHVSANTIKRGVLDGRIKPVRVGRDHTGTVMVHKEDVARINDHYKSVWSIK